MAIGADQVERSSIVVLNIASSIAMKLVNAARYCQIFIDIYRDIHKAMKFIDNAWYLLIHSYL